MRLLGLLFAHCVLVYVPLFFFFFFYYMYFPSLVFFAIEVPHSQPLFALRYRGLFATSPRLRRVSRRRRSGGSLSLSPLLLSLRAPSDRTRDHGLGQSHPRSSQTAQPTRVCPSFFFPLSLSDILFYFFYFSPFQIFGRQTLLQNRLDG